jgi:hypothetical protein
MITREKKGLNIKQQWTPAGFNNNGKIRKETCKYTNKQAIITCKVKMCITFRGNVRGRDYRLAILIYINVHKFNSTSRKIGKD